LQRQPDLFGEDHRTIRHYLTDLLILTGRTEEADRELRLLEQDGSQGGWIQLLRGQYSMRRGDRAAATRACAEALRRDPQLGDTFYDGAGRLVDAGRFDHALFWYESVELMMPDSTSVHYGKGLALAGLGRKAEAIAAFEEYLRSDSTSEWARLARDKMRELRG